MKKILYSFGLLSMFWGACALAQVDDAPALKVTLSLITNSASATAAITPGNTSSTPLLQAAPASMSVAATVLDVEAITRKPSRRRIEYSEDHIAIVGLSADASELTRTVMIDPRLVRVEALRGENDLSFRHLFRQSVEFSFVVNDEAVVSFQILKPRWDGSQWSFDVLAEARVQ